MKKTTFIIAGILLLTLSATFILDKKNENNRYDTSILVVGDNMFSRSIGESIKKGKDPYRNVKSDFNRYGLVVANLECVISERGTPHPDKDFTLRAPIETTNVIKKAGIDLVSLANNHSMDYGSKALIDMMQRLDESNINHFGSGKDSDDAFSYKIMTTNGVKIAFIGFNEHELHVSRATRTSAGSTWNDMSKLTKLIRQAKHKTNIVLVMPHWGTEYDMTQNEKQRKEAKQLIDSGADIIVGAHPHVIQGHEKYKGKDIYYSIGNFLFVGNNMDRITTKGYGLEIFIKDKKIVKTNLKHVKLNKDTGYPSFTQNFFGGIL